MTRHVQLGPSVSLRSRFDICLRGGDDEVLRKWLAFSSALSVSCVLRVALAFLLVLVWSALPACVRWQCALALYTHPSYIRFWSHFGFLFPRTISWFGVLLAEWHRGRANRPVCKNDDLSAQRL